MKNVQKELLSISASLSSLTQKVEKIAEAIGGKSVKTAPVKKTKAVKKGVTKAKKKAAPKKTARKKKASSPKKTPVSSGQTMLDTIYGMISRSRNGIPVAAIKKRTDFEARQVSNALYKLTKKGMIETISRGVYIKKKK
jgi:hypothetical protein